MNQINMPSQPAVQELVSILEGALAEDLLQYHSQEWVSRARAAIAEHRSALAKTLRQAEQSDIAAVDAKTHCKPIAFDEWFIQAANANKAYDRNYSRQVWAAALLFTGISQRTCAANERERAARLALQWSNARHPHQGGDALRNYAEALRGGAQLDERDTDYHWSKTSAATRDSAPSKERTSLLQAAGAMRWVRAHNCSGESFAAYDKDIADLIVENLRTELHELEEHLKAAQHDVLNSNQINALRRAAETLDDLDHEDTAGDLRQIIASQY